MDLIECKNIASDYQVIRQLGLENHDIYCRILPVDIEHWIHQQQKRGFQVGIFDIKNKVTIYKSDNFKGHEDYKNVNRD